MPQTHLFSRLSSLSIGGPSPRMHSMTCLPEDKSPSPNARSPTPPATPGAPGEDLWAWLERRPSFVADDDVTSFTGAALPHQCLLPRLVLPTEHPSGPSSARHPNSGTGVCSCITFPASTFPASSRQSLFPELMSFRRNSEIQQPHTRNQPQVSDFNLEDQPTFAGAQRPPAQRRKSQHVRKTTRRSIGGGWNGRAEMEAKQALKLERSNSDCKAKSPQEMSPADRPKSCERRVDFGRVQQQQVMRATDVGCGQLMIGDSGARKGAS